MDNIKLLVSRHMPVGGSGFIGLHAIIHQLAAAEHAAQCYFPRVFPIRCWIRVHGGGWCSELRSPPDGSEMDG